jgi:hypothetical protein
MSMRRVAMLVAVALMAACGSDGDSGSSDEDRDPPEESSGNEEEERDLDADQELADAAVLTIDDVPAGFEAEPEDDDDDDSADEVFDHSFAECVGITVAELNDDDDEPQASTTFANEAQEEVSSEVTVYATEEEVTEDLEMVKDPASQDCFAEAMNEGFATDTDVEIGEITVEDLVLEDLGEDAVGLGLAIPFAVEGGERVLYLDLVLIQQGRAGISMGFTAFDAPFDEQIGYELAATVVDRVSADA